MVKNITTRRRPIPGVAHYRYEVLLGDKVIHSQISALDVTDVANAVHRYQEQRRLAKAARAAAPAQPAKAQCKRCLKERPLDQFGTNGGRRLVCNTCRAKTTVVRKACASATS